MARRCCRRSARAVHGGHRHRGRSMGPSAHRRAVVEIGTNRTMLIEGGSDARYVPTGHIVYALSGSLYAVAFDLRPAENRGERLCRLSRASAATAGESLTARAAQLQRLDTGYPRVRSWPGLGIGGPDWISALMDPQGKVEPLKLPARPVRRGRACLRTATASPLRNDDGKEAIVWIYDLSGTTTMRAAHVRREQPLSDLDVRTARASRFSRIAKAISPSSGSPPTAGTAPNASRRRIRRITCAGVLVSDGRRAPVQRHQRDRTCRCGRSRCRTRRRRPSARVRRVSHRAVFSPDGRWVAYSSTEREEDDDLRPAVPCDRRASRISSSSSQTSHTIRCWSPGRRGA